MSEKCFVDIHYSHVCVRSNSNKIAKYRCVLAWKGQWGMIYHCKGSICFKNGSLKSISASVCDLEQQINKIKLKN